MLIVGIGTQLTLFAIGSGCGSPGTTESSGAGGEATTVTLHPDESPLSGESECTVVEQTDIVVSNAYHLATCTPVAYTTNPPSGGPHWVEWAPAGKYTEPVPRQMYVHDTEHGFVVLAYRCQNACPEVVAALTKVFDDAGDAYCASQGSGVVRVILTPDPLLKTPIAVSAWGATYTATCIDPASLADFVAKRIGRGTEMICGGGTPPGNVSAQCATADPNTDGGLDGG